MLPLIVMDPDYPAGPGFIGWLLALLLGGRG
jgi:hypothetical protein